MKKVMLSAALLAMVGIATVNAEMMKTPLASETVLTLQDKTPVKIEELPDAVKGTLASDDYAGWAPKEVSLVKSSDGNSYYEVSLTKGEEIRVINLDGAGKVVATSTQPTATQ